VAGGAREEREILMVFLAFLAVKIVSFWVIRQTASSLIASGMVANAGLATVVSIYAKDPAQTALT
jgi:hypothetical protein